MALSIDLRERVAAAYEAGNGSYEEIAENFGVAICSVRRWVALLRKTGSVKKRSAPGAVPKIKDFQLVELVKLVEEKPDLGLNELCAIWQERFGVVISKSAMDYSLARANLTFKKKHFGLKNARTKVPGKNELNS
jgi:transposase